MDLPNPNKMLVEGEEDKRVIPQLIEANGVPWGENRREWIVEIRALGSIDAILAPGSIRTHLKERNLKRLGIVVDANAQPERRWQRLRGQCIDAFPLLPEKLPSGGVVVDNEHGLSLGIWLLPDNGSRGMLETFLSGLVPDGSGELWTHAERAAGEARQLGAPYKEVHRDKANLYTWLAWQDPPGRQLHDALIQRILDPRSRYAARFVAWFRRLYRV